MNKPLILVPEARADVVQACRWYEEQSLGLGLEFLRCVEARLVSIQRTPLIYPEVHETYRRALVRRFPFAIFFEYDRKADRCIVFSVFIAHKIRTSGIADCQNKAALTRPSWRRAGCTPKDSLRSSNSKARGFSRLYPVNPV